MNTYEKIYELLPNEYRVMGDYVFIEQDKHRIWYIWMEGQQKKVLPTPAAHAIIETLARRYINYIDTKTLQAAEHGDFQKAKFNLDSNAAIYWHAINPQPYVVLAAVQAAREWEDRNK